MPGISRGHKAEAKYNVTLDFPHLGLHSAATSGDIGLVKYALEHGQPINSALDGVLPLHAACSGGNDLVVRLLIDRGADVNAPRLPRRYSSDKNRDTAAPIVGTSGSTPLHFACANGHLNVVLTLLLHGAHPDRPDKHGITPEILARQKGFTECADVLKQWSHNKDKDLRDREDRIPRPYPDILPDTHTPPHHYCAQSDCRDCSTRKRLRVKQSIDNALHIFRPSVSLASSSLVAPPTPGISSANDIPQPPSPTLKPLGNYSFYPTPDPTQLDDYPRRPSLPHVFDPSRPSHSSQRRPSNFSLASSRPRRPRSAGTDAEPQLPAAATPNKVKGKLSLLNIFKKSSVDAYGTPESFSGYTSSSSAFTSGSPSPAPESRSLLARTASPTHKRSVDALTATPPDSSPLSAFRIRSRLASDNASLSPNPPQAVELHHALSRDSLRGQYVLGHPAESQTTKSPPVRPGILRAHGRTSSGQSQSQIEGSRSTNVPSNLSGQAQTPSGQSVRALRFDSSSTTSSSQSFSRRPEARDPHRHTSRSPTRVLHPSGSINSLRSRSPGSPLAIHREPEEILPLVTSPDAIGSEGIIAPPRDRGNDIEEEDEEEYGHIVQPHVGLKELSLEDSPLRDGDVLGDSSPPTESPEGGLRNVFECPFSINCPPPDEASPPMAREYLGIEGIEGRTRGDSMSSMLTDVSGNPPSSSSTSGYIETPAVSMLSLPAVAVSSPLSPPPDLPLGGVETGMEAFDIEVKKKADSMDAEEKETRAGGLMHKRSRAPMDIDIRSISSHAQAEALVQAAQQRILDFENSPVLEESEGMGVLVGEGRTPLSARLAAYGESLSIERKFKEEEEKMRSPSASRMTLSPSVGSESRGMDSMGTLKGSYSARGLDRKFSLEERARVQGGRSRVRKVRRPHTAGGTPLSDTPPTLFTSDPMMHHHSSSVGAITTSSSSVNKSSPLRQPRILVASITPPSSNYLKVRADTFPVDRPSLPLARSRTPDPSPEGNSFSGGEPLSRYSTAPDDGFCDERPGRLTKEEREVARASKLTKMGFSAGGDSWQTTGAGASRGHKHRFNGIRTLVQSLTGKN